MIVYMFPECKMLPPPSVGMATSTLPFPADRGEVGGSVRGNPWTLGLSCVRVTLLRREGSTSGGAESLLLQIGPLNILVDCPLDWEELVCQPPLFTPCAADANQQIPECVPKLHAAIPAAACAHREERPKRGTQHAHKYANRTINEYNTTDSHSYASGPSSPSPFESSFSLLSSCLPLGIHLVLATCASGLLGLPRLAELVDLRNTNVLVTYPAMAIAAKLFPAIAAPECGRLVASTDGHTSKTAAHKHTSTHAHGPLEAESLVALEVADEESGGSDRFSSFGSESSACGGLGGPLSPLVPAASSDASVSASQASLDDGAPSTATAATGLAAVDGVVPLALQRLPCVVVPLVFGQVHRVVVESPSSFSSGTDFSVRPYSSGHTLGGANWRICTPQKHVIAVLGATHVHAQQLQMHADMLAKADEPLRNASYSMQGDGRPHSDNSQSGGGGKAAGNDGANAPKRYPKPAQLHKLLRNADLACFFKCMVTIRNCIQFQTPYTHLEQLNCYPRHFCIVNFFQTYYYADIPLRPRLPMPHYYADIVLFFSPPARRFP
eukprot:GHVT01058848.1.p1 GENE.GHVT01058848.1~~GHVT01058848.1.p1  ORF type:complete len:553 (+),score=75.29 GHVT01058848.1:667-2325(+)